MYYKHSHLIYYKATIKKILKIKNMTFVKIHQKQKNTCIIEFNMKVSGFYPTHNKIQ